MNHPSNPSNGSTMGITQHEFQFPVILDDDQAILDILARHKGPDQAISAKDIGATIGVDPRTIRARIRYLRMTLHKPICSQTTKPPGFFWAENADQLNASYERWFRFGIKNLAMAVRLRPDKFPDMMHQVALELQSEMSHE